VKDNK